MEYIYLCTENLLTNSCLLLCNRKTSLSFTWLTDGGTKQYTGNYCFLTIANCPDIYNEQILWFIFRGQIIKLKLLL